MKTFTLFICSLLMATMAQGQIIHVPADYTTIQLGINAANSGDTVLVAEGTYFEQINFLGKKPLMVASEFLMDGDTNHIANTIIDGSQLTNLDNASVVYFISGEDTTSILCGFTIQHGRGTYTPDNLYDQHGGGIWIADAGAKISHNRITHNTCDDTQGGNGNSTYGGGIGTKYAEADYWIVIENNTIDSNTCISKYDFAFGGGIATSYNARLINNIITHNTCSGLGNAAAQGGGIASGKDASWTNPVMLIAEHNRITHNLTQAVNNFANAAGVGCLSFQVKFSGNKVENNTVITGNGAGGVAAMLIFQPDPGSVISNNVFKGNNSNLWAGVCLENDVILDNPVLVENNYFLDNSAHKGGAFVSYNAPVILQNNVFNGNHADLHGGAIYVCDFLFQTDGHLATMINNTFSNNTASVWGGAIYSQNVNPLIFNSIFWADSAFVGNEIYAESTDIVEIAYSNINPDFIYGEFLDGGDNINEDPMFEDTGLLTISGSSPCINSGTLDFVCDCGLIFDAPAYDILGLPRPMNGYHEMGAYEVLLEGVADNPADHENGWYNNSPNPFTGKTLISYELNDKTFVEIGLYTSAGILIQNLFAETQEAGSHTLEFEAGTLPAGIYFYRIATNTQQATGKMILMK